MKEKIRLLEEWIEGEKTKNIELTEKYTQLENGINKSCSEESRKEIEILKSRLKNMEEKVEGYE